MKKITILFVLSILPFSYVSSVNASSKSLSPFLYKQFAKVRSVMEIESWSEAREMLTTLSQETSNKYALALINQSIGQIAIHQENMREALDRFIAAHDSGELEDQVRKQLLHSIAQLHCAVEEWLSCQDKMQQWILASPENVKASDYMVVAQAYAATESWEELVIAARRAISMKSVAPKSWYQLLVAAYTNTSSWEDAIRVQTTLLSYYDNSAEEWRRLVAAYVYDEDLQGALNAMRIPFERGILNAERDYRQIAQLLYQAGVPFQAASIMQKGINQGIVKSTQKNVKQMAGLWLEAKAFDQAISAYHMLLKIETKRQWYKQIASLHFQKNEWLAASRVLRAATKKESSFDLELMLGVSLINLHKFDEAKSILEPLIQQENVKARAENWLNYLEQIQKA